VFSLFTSVPIKAHLSSIQELRLQDYAQGRKTAGAFGQSAAFGNTQPTNTGLFGAQPAQQNPAQPSIFGAPAANQTTTSAFGPFGQTPANQPATAPAATGLFGSATFGQTQQQPQQQTTGFGTFGQPAQQQTQQQQQAGGLFGSGGTFGTTSKPAFSAFSGGMHTRFTLRPYSYSLVVLGGGGAFSGGGTGVFGQQNQQQQQQPTTGLFGQSQPAAPTTGFGAFGKFHSI
jgi:nuclear pore complex protein Nup98-Nup96